MIIYVNVNNEYFIGTLKYLRTSNIPQKTFQDERGRTASVQRKKTKPQKFFTNTIVTSSKQKEKRRRRKSRGHQRKNIGPTFTVYFSRGLGITLSTGFYHLPGGYVGCFVLCLWEGFVFASEYFNVFLHTHTHILSTISQCIPTWSYWLPINKSYFNGIFRFSSFASLERSDPEFSFHTPDV